jgi:serine/threonine protein phosphatase 1
MPDRRKFAKLRASARIWAVSAIHGEAERLESLHMALWPKLAAGDRVVYLGNMIGRGGGIRETLAGLLAFRRAFLSRPQTFACDLVYLRGSQEEMWQKLLQLQFATDPSGVLSWMLEQGVGATLEAYDGDIEQARQAARTGTLALTRWSGRLRQAMQTRPGHFELLGALRRAAYTNDESLLFVNAGLDPTRPLEAQFDSFWWGEGTFHQISEPYRRYRRVVRGYDAQHPGFLETEYTLTVDGGCGFGGPLLAACLTPDGVIAERIEA